MSNLKLLTVKDVGDIAKERVVISVISDGNIGPYLLLCAKSNSKTLQAGGSLAYWFPNTDVKSGDTVVVYSKEGSSKRKPINERTTFFFYWGQANSIWNNNQRGAALGTFGSWESWRIGGFEEENDVEP